jgi:hypothetical protein
MLTKKFAIQKVDNAIQKISSERLRQEDVINLLLDMRIEFNNYVPDVMKPQRKIREKV